MTDPENDLEQALRRALSAAVGRVEPGANGRERIRARTEQRPPQPRLVAVANGVLDRARHWVWRGHWSWPEHLARARTSGTRPAAKRQLFAGQAGANWLRPLAVLAGVAFIAVITLAVPPFRQAIAHVSSNVLTGGDGPGGPGTDGSGTLTRTGTSSGGATSQVGSGTTTSSRTAALPGTTPTSKCPKQLTAQGGASSTPSGAPTAAQVSAGPVPSFLPVHQSYPSSSVTVCPTPSLPPTPSPWVSQSPAPSATRPTATATRPTATATSPSATATSPSATATRPSATATSPSATATSPSATATSPSASPSGSGLGDGKKTQGSNQTAPPTGSSAGNPAG